MAEKIRVKRTSSYTTLQNSMVLDQRLSLKARGLMAVMLSRPDEWEFSVSGLAAFCGCGKDAIRSALAELEAADYLLRRQVHADDGSFASNEYILHDVSPSASAPSPLSENPTTGKPSTGFPSSGNPTQRNKDLKKEPPKVPHDGRRKSVPKWKPDRFEAFWAYYRDNARGEDHVSAVREWDRLRLDDGTIDSMGLALKRQIRHWHDNGGIGIPYACRYLKNRRWEDPLPSAEEQGTRAVFEDRQVQEWT